MVPDFRAAALAAARACDEKKGEEVFLFHLGATSPIADYLLIMTALSKPHLEALQETVKRALELFHIKVLHQAGARSGSWRVFDFGGIVAHLMTAQTRDFYALDKLYHDAPRIRWRRTCLPRRGALAPPPGK